MKIPFLTLGLLVHLLPAKAQTVGVPFSSPRWAYRKIEQAPDPKGHVLEEYLGKPSVRLKFTDALLKDANFTNGIIEYDVAFPAGRGFIGVSFRVQDDENFENFYIRPHQSGNPDATQYQPVFNGKAAWQLYHGEGYSAAVPFVYDQWMHVKLVVSGSRMEVYLSDGDQPALFVPALKRHVQAGGLALGGDAHFANFSYTPLDQPALKGTPKPVPPAPLGTLPRWQVSSAFAEATLKDVLQLSTAQKTGLSWQTLTSEPSGTLNLATGPKGPESTNTVFTRQVLLADEARIVRLQLGFSDRVKAYLNDQILYAGHDEFLSRDYRFLGTIGYFDEVYLPLKKGRNELWIAVSENFGGWGIQGRIEDQTGIRVEMP